MGYGISLDSDSTGAYTYEVRLPLGSMEGW
jgi:hypothetical protein